MIAKQKNDVLTPYLQADEYLLWVGQPDPHKFLSMEDFILIPFSLFWNGILLLMGMGIGLFVLLFPHVWIGLWLLPGRFIYGYFARQLTLYAVTNKRILTLNTLWQQSLTSLFFDQLSETRIQVWNKDKGSLQFLSVARQSATDDGESSFSGNFEGIEDVHYVYHLINEQRDEYIEAKMQRLQHGYDADEFENTRHRKRKQR